MTVLVGVRCTDGVVIGSDSIATSAGGDMGIMQIQSNDKITIHSNSIIVAGTGSVGYSQRCNHHVSEAIRGQVFRNLSKIECATNISRRMIGDLQGSMAPSYNAGGYRFGILLAAALKDVGPCLIEYGTSDFQPEFKEGRLFYVSMGSGQMLADPFLAFISRVLWKNQMPTVDIAKLGVLWTLQHTIAFAPGGVGGDPVVSTLTQADNRWTASKMSEQDTQESLQYVSQLEDHIGKFAIDSIQDATSSEPPAPPQA